jgi:glycosyltransferase involved in cell wall biosynthesis
LRVAVVHSFYRRALPSGENRAVLDQVDWLRAAGHEVHVIARSTDAEMGRTLYPLRASLTVMSGRGGSPLPELARLRPDIVHVHNLFPNIGTDWLRHSPAPVVTTLHNFRPLCANGLLFRDGRVCHDCPDGQPWSGLRHACYRGSTVATLPLTLAGLRTPHPLLRHSAALVCLSVGARDVFVRYGAEAARLHVIPNGVDAAPVEQPADDVSGDRWLFAGRLTPEKGALDLARDWPGGRTLDIAGEGPEAAAIGALGNPAVRQLGPLSREELLGALPGYVGVVVPSPCLEMQPTVALEAMAAGIPVVARAGNAAADLVADLGCGTVYRDRSDLDAALGAALADRADLGRAGRQGFADRFTRDRWVTSITELYAALRGA